MVNARGVIVTLVLALALSATSCSDGEGNSSATPEPSTSSTAAIIDGEPCPKAPPELQLPSGSGCASFTTGTFEPGEDQAKFISYASLDERALPVEWHLRVTRSSEDPLDETVQIGSAASYPVVIGSEDADRDGLDEVFVKLLTHSYHSGKTHELGIFGVDTDEFFQVRADGEPLLFQVGGVSVFGQGAECRDVDADGTPEFLLLHVDGVVNDVQEIVERIYRWRDRSLVLIERDESRMAKTGYSDPLLWRYYSFRCLDFEPPPPYVHD